METQSALMGALAALALLVPFLALRREPAARGFAALALAYLVWCAGVAATNLGVPLGPVLADLGLLAAAPLAPWVAATTTSPGFSRNFCQATAVRSASARVVMVTACSAKPGTTSVWLR